MADRGFSGKALWLGIQTAENGHMESEYRHSQGTRRLPVSFGRARERYAGLGKFHSRRGSLIQCTDAAARNKRATA